MMNRVVLLALSLAACGGAATAGPPADNKPEVTAKGDIADPCWPVAPMRIAVEHAGQWEPVAEMIGDGSMYSLKRGERHFVGRVANDSVLDAHDTPSMTCIHREIDVVGAGNRGKYDADDAYVDARTRIAVGDDGAITMTLGAHPPQTSGRVEGVTRKTRRTAVLFVMSVLVSQ